MFLGDLIVFASNKCVSLFKRSYENVNCTTTVETFLIISKFIIYVFVKKQWGYLTTIKIIIVKHSIVLVMFLIKIVEMAALKILIRKNIIITYLARLTIIILSSSLLNINILLKTK